MVCFRNFASLCIDTFKLFKNAHGQELNYIFRKTRLCFHGTFYALGTGEAFQEVRRLEREADHSPPWKV
jgi:hypothetical protein